MLRALAVIGAQRASASLAKIALDVEKI